VTTTLDTVYHYWHCTEWDGDVCLYWEQVPIPGEGDSTSMVISPHSELDPAQTQYTSGMIRVVPLCYRLCGDANADGEVNSGDAVAIINYVFKGGFLPDDDKCADPNK